MVLHTAAFKMGVMAMPTGEDEFASANRQFFLLRQFFSVQIVDRFKV